MRRRQGFTLVELMVSMALIVFIMTILTEAFTAALGTFRQLKAIGDMQEKLRTASIIIRSDLAAYHFEDVRRLSDANFLTYYGASSGAPVYGFFRVAGEVPTTEGSDADGIPSVISPNPSSPTTTTSPHVMHFTIQTESSGQSLSQYFSSLLPPSLPSGTSFPVGPLDYQQTGTAISQWAEVAYFLDTPVTSGGPAVTANGTPLYALYRRQLMVFNTADAATIMGLTPTPNPQQDTYFSYSCSPASGGGFNSPASLINLTSPNARGMGPGSLNSTLSSVTPSPFTPGYIPLAKIPGVPQQNYSDDLLLTNVIGFTISVLPAPASGPPGSSTFIPIGSFNSSSGTNVGVFDTGNSPLQNILAIQITIRIWDEKTNQSRQITITQNL